MANKYKIPERSCGKLIDLVFRQAANNIMKLIFAQNLPESKNLTGVNDKDLESIQRISLLYDWLLELRGHGTIKTVGHIPCRTVTKNPPR